MKLSDELKRCLDGSGCKDCEHHEADTKFICRGLLEKAYERINGYEDLEEKGRLFILPFRETDIVWVLEEDKRKICKCVVANIGSFKRDTFVVLERDISQGMGFIRTGLYSFGKTVFLTKSEAENALQKMNEMEGKK